MSKLLSKQYIEQAISNVLFDQKCADMHEGSCNSKGMQQFIGGCKGVYKMYLIVHLLPFVLFKKKKLMRNPQQELKKLIIGFVKSLIFAGGYSMLVRRCICLLTQYYGYHTFVAYISGVLGGASLIFEPIGRQSQIALFCLNKSMEVTYNMAIRRKLPIKIPYGECWLNAIALAIISFIYLDNSEVYRDNYRKVLDKLLKNV